jgi:hypothetical protein
VRQLRVLTGRPRVKVCLSGILLYFTDVESLADFQEFGCQCR